MKNKYDNSKIQCYIDCPRKYYYEWELFLTTEIKDINLFFGICIHKALETWYKQYQGTGNIEKLKNDIIEQFTVDFTSEEVNSNMFKNVDNGVNLLKLYFSEPSYYNFGKVLNVEIEVSYKRLAGKIDLVTKSKNGVLYIIDHKTIGRLDQKTKGSKWRQHRGTLQYHFLAHHLPAYTLQGTTKVVSVINILHTIKKPEILRVPLLFEEETLSEWFFETEHWINKIIFSKRQNKWPKAGTICQSYGCDFISLCSQPVQLKDIIIPSDFIKREDWYC